MSFLDPAIQRCPYELYKKLRSEAPVYWAEEMKCFIVSSYALSRKVLGDPQVYSNLNALTRVANEEVADRIAAIRASGYPQVPFLATNDPPTHTGYRKLATGLFHARRIQSMKGNVESIIRGLFEPFIAKGGGEVMHEVAMPLPILVIADLLGIPRDNVLKYREWSDAFVDPLNGLISAEREVECAEQMLEYQRYFAAIVEERRRFPTDDLISEMIVAEVPGEARTMDMPELLSCIQQFLVAGGETTTFTLGNGLLMMAQQPALIRELRQSDAKLESFVEELLRLRSPSQGLYRIVLQDTELAGVAIPKGSVVSVRIAAANRDETVFEDSEQLNLGRSTAKPHLAFGSGIHFCMGAPLARMELFAAFRRFVHAAERIEVDEPSGGFDYVPSVFFLALKHLHLKVHLKS